MAKYIFLFLSLILSLGFLLNKNTSHVLHMVQAQSPLTVVPTVTFAPDSMQTAVHFIQGKEEVIGLSDRATSYGTNFTMTIFDWIVQPIINVLLVILGWFSSLGVSSLDVRLPVVFDSQEKIPDIFVGLTPNTTMVVGKKIIEQPIMGGLMVAPAVVYFMWSVVREISVIFLLLFLVVIGFMIMLQFRLKSYEIKKILPRYFIGIVLVQTSWIIVSVLVDFFSIMGFAVMRIASMINLPTSAWSTGFFGVSPVASVGGISLTFYDVLRSGIVNFIANLEREISTATHAIAGGVVTGMIGPVAVIFSIMGMPFLLLILLGIFIGQIMFLSFVLIRMFLLFACAILAPAVFLLYIFPETASLASTWFKMLIGLLIVFPLAVLNFQLFWIMAITI